MDQYELFTPVCTTSRDESSDLDPEKYRAARVECRYQHLAPATAYGYGCRCAGCRSYRAADVYRRKSGPLPCSFPGCTEPRRRVQAARYCEQHATSKAYEWIQQHTIPTECAVCHEMRRINRQKVYQICSPCQDANTRLIQQAASHHVNQAQLVKLIHDPSCTLCGKRFYVGRGRGKSGFVIDHDHSCCHGGKSCGQCIRGVLCSSCNLSLGHVESMIGRATRDRLLAYLDRTE